MNIPADTKYTEEMLREAMEMLEGLKHHMGMFQNQYYGKLKKRFKHHEALNETLRVALNEVDTRNCGRQIECVSILRKIDHQISLKIPGDVKL